jgi:type IV pilus assembly protein PilV
MAGLKYSASAAHRLEAVNQANDILERMRANPFQALDGHYNLEMGEFPQTNGLAQSDLEQWKAALMASLPSGDGSIKVSERVVTITVQWSENWDSTLEGGLARIHLRTQL